VSDIEALEWALRAATTAAGQGASPDSRLSERMAQVGTAAIESLRNCETHPAWRLQMPGAPDPMLETRHNVRAAAQEVLGQLELIGLAWSSWDEPTRGEMLADLERVARELTDHAQRFVRDVV
jgi:hypothetical protein